MCFVLEQGALFRHCNFQKWSECVVSETFWLRSALRATTPCTLQHATSKFLRSCGVLYIFTWKCASPQFSNISTFKSAPNPLCFSHFDVQMCFPPQRCALFRHLHMGASQKSGMDRSAVIRTMDRECLRKVPDPYPFVRAHHSIQTVLILPDLLFLLLLLLLLKLLPLLVEGAGKKKQHQQQ